MRALNDGKLLLPLAEYNSAGYRSINLFKEFTMRKALLATALVSGLIFAPFGFAQQNAKSEFGHHPRIANAVRALEGAIEYMEHAPHDFGGHKAQAIADSRKAIEQLREAMKYRATQDNMKKGKK